MTYEDGNEAMVGDLVQIDIKYRGKVVACMDRNEYLPGREHWAYLKEGVMIDTDFGGLVHYTSEVSDDLILLSRGE